MASTLQHRGPDDAGTWTDAKSGIALAHRRLSIIELSEAGHQPMTSHCGRYIIVFNGEIYNYRELSSELHSRGHQSTGSSDTEVILNAVSEWGFEAALPRFVGMFAMAVWDRLDHVLYLARDRMGEKPLYYGWSGTCFLFASELKAFCAHPDWNGEISQSASALFAKHGYIPGPYSIYEGIHKLRPGSFLTLNPRADQSSSRDREFWSLRNVAAKRSLSAKTASPEEAVRELDCLIRGAVRLQMVADVPVGAFLSGGIDSSTVVAAMQVQSRRPVKTFTIGFTETGFNEAGYAKKVAAHLGTEHTELFLGAAEAAAILPQIPTIYDEPFADSSQIPTCLVSKLARRSVTVALSGDGGDELFGGYERYRIASKTWRTLQALPVWARSSLGGALSLVSAAATRTQTNGERESRRAWSSYNRKAVLRLNRMAGLLKANGGEEIYLDFVTHRSDSLLAMREEAVFLKDIHESPPGICFEEKMMFLDSLTYLPDDILVKVDRASMAVSLEARVPLLDHRIVEFAWGLPINVKMKGEQGKWILRQVLNKYLPSDLIERPKMGFGIPLGAWLRGPMREWAEDLLDSGLENQQFFAPEKVRALWKMHLARITDSESILWIILSYLSWLNSSKTRPAKCVER